MITKSHYSKSFHSDQLTRQKYGEFMDLAKLLRAVRNELSVVVNNDKIKYQEMSKIDFQKAMLPLIKDRVHSNFTKQLCDDVYKTFQFRFELVQRRIKFNGPTTIVFHLYKRGVPHKGKKAGDLKSKERVSKSTNLSKVLSFLAKYGSEATPGYVRSAAANPDVLPSKLKFYQLLQDICEKFGFDRLEKLALLRRENTLNRYKDPIEFKSLSFRGRSRIKKDIVSLNHNKKSVIKAFIEVSWLGRGETIRVPVRHSYVWHGRELSAYTNGTDTSYTVCFVEQYKQLRFICTKEGNRYLPEVTEADCTDDKVIGFDVNSKHSQIIGSKLDIEVDHNRKALGKLLSELKISDELKSNNKDYEVGKRRQAKLNTLRRSVVSHTRSNCALIAKKMRDSGFTHAVFEDLDKSFGKSFVRTPESVNYNRLISEMQLCSVKDEFEHAAKKYDVATSFVPGAYTSQECSVCHYIDEGNRMTQEKFKCLECGHEENADKNASSSVKWRVVGAVRNDLLEAKIELGGAFRPLARFGGKHHTAVKKVILAFREAQLSTENRGESERALYGRGALYG